MSSHYHRGVTSPPYETGHIMFGQLKQDHFVYKNNVIPLTLYPKTKWDAAIIECKERWGTLQSPGGGRTLDRELQELHMSYNSQYNFAFNITDRIDRIASKMYNAFPALLEDYLLEIVSKPRFLEYLNMYHQIITEGIELGLDIVYKKKPYEDIIEAVKKYLPTAIN